MIDFPCKCGHPFSVPADQAGGLIQCPNCGLLADVPTLSDLPNINSDGTFAFEETAPPAENVTAADLHRVFTNKTVDSRGIEKDLRNKPEQIEIIGVTDAIKPRAAPRYDPVTGELIRPLQLKDETPTPVLSLAEIVDPSELDNELDNELGNQPEPDPLPVVPIPVGPIPKVRSLGYAVGDTRKQVTLKTLALELLMPANTAVMFFIFLLYLLGYLATMGIATYVERFFPVVWPFQLVNIPMWLIIAHIGCVIEDTGPDAVDELPRPLRNFSLGEDIVNPLFNMLLAGIICFSPVLLALHYLNFKNPGAMPIVLLLGGGGAFFFPAVALTSVTGTTVLNLRPDRVAAVLKICGPQYFVSIILFLLAMIPSIYYLAGELLFPQRLTGPFFTRIDSPPLLLPIFICTIYFAHFFAWHLGLMYRQNHEQFPWLAQRHIRRNQIRIVNR